MTVVADLEVTLPPSANRSSRIGVRKGKGGKHFASSYKNPAYVTAQNAIAWEVLEARGKGQVIRERWDDPFVVAIVHSSDEGGDADNRIKPIIDSLAKAEVIGNDKQSLGGVYAVSSSVPKGRARVVILGVEPATRPPGMLAKDWNLEKTKRGLAAKLGNLVALMVHLNERGIT